MKPYSVANNQPSLPDWPSLWAREHGTGTRPVVEKVVHCEQIDASCEDPSVVDHRPSLLLKGLTGAPVIGWMMDKYCIRTAIQIWGDVS